MKPFTNEPFTDFTQTQLKDQMEHALAKVKKELGKTYPLIIHGEEETSSKTFVSLNPANTQDVIGTFQEADERQTERAVQSALKAFDSWKTVPADRRAQYLFDMSAIIKSRKFELAAWLIYEAGKSWREADAEMAEAIDFLEYYGREMIRLSSPPKLIPVASEENRLVYLPLGVGAIVTPWNFPFAILTGMTVAAVVTGNTVILKPSEFAPATGAKFMKIVKEVGLPDGVINYLTGRGATVGRALVNHPQVRFVSFTGSKKVGLEINEAAAKTQPGQKWIKRVVAEMGGKDFIIVDRDADIDNAVEGVIKSAFGYGGQKCSACSRAIVDEAIYDTFVAQLLEKTKKLKVASPESPDTSFGPLISEAAVEKASSYIHIGKKEGKLLLGGDVDTSRGYYVKPTIIGDVRPDARIAQEEIFAPVLALIKSKNFDEAIRIANDTEYGLTGAFYTKDPEKQKKGLQQLHVGNLYLNRGCTGALVGVHPFGGFNMSGTNSKAGGPDYLLLFMQAKSISEKRSTT